MASPETAPPVERAIAAAQTRAEAAFESGRPEDALPAFREVVRLLPGSGVARHNLAVCLARLGVFDEAIHCLTRALALEPDRGDTARMLAARLRACPRPDPDRLVPEGLAAAINHTELNPQHFIRAASAYLVAHGPIATAVHLARTEDPIAAARWLLGPAGAAARNDGLLLQALANGINVDYELELVLTGARRLMLLEDGFLERDGGALERFACALVRQCINNEYVWVETEAEEAKLGELKERCQHSDSGIADARTLLRLVLYLPIRELARLGIRGADIAGVRAAELGRLLRDELIVAEEEHRLSATLETLSGGVLDPTSEAVAAQYEENPYPRWLRLDPPRPASEILQPFFTSRELAGVGTSPRILIAGCGTGKQALRWARNFGPEAAVLAVDISRSSLAYARRMTDHLGVTNIHYAHADILALDPIAHEFDIIACDGVLHHLADPMAGWRILTGVLRPGGLMHVGLYSALARQAIARVRRSLNVEESPITDRRLIARYRAELLLSNLHADPAARIHSYDFFTYSGFRDLMFHAREHRFTLPQVCRALAELSLDFRGFTLPRHVLDDFRRDYPDERDFRDLDKWWAFEQRAPNTFTKMYQFWCWKPHAA